MVVSTILDDEYSLVNLAVLSELDLQLYLSLLSFSLNNCLGKGTQTKKAK